MDTPMGASGTEGVGESVARFLQHFGEVMGNVILALLYFLLLGPVAILYRLASDPLRTRRPSGSAFLPWRKENETIAEAYRQG
jgi:hypothetical protein